MKKRGPLQQDTLLKRLLINQADSIPQPST